MSCTLRTAALCSSLPLVALLAGCPTGGGGDDDDDVSGFDAVPVGAFAVTEIQANPLANRPEYVEIVNTTDVARSLRGCQIGTGGASSNAFIVVGDVDVAPGALALFASQASLGSAEGDIPVDVVWTGIAINQNDPTETIELACPDGSGGRATTDTVGFDPEVGWAPRRGRSWQLAGDLSAALNDDPANWCEAPASPEAEFAVIDGFSSYGTPGLPTLCDEPGGATPGEGDLVISEIAVDPCTGTKEWFEVHNPGAASLDLRGCQIVDEPVDGSAKPNLHTLDPERGVTTVPAGGYLVLNASTISDPSTAITGDGAVQADYPFANSVSFGNDGNQYLSIVCPGGGSVVTVDRVVYNWETQGQGLKGRTLSLDPARLDAEENDDLASFCLGSATYATGEECSDYGSPGAANPACPVPDPYPQPGDLVVTELMALSSSGVGTNEEWLEIKNVSGGRLGLVGCTLSVDDGAEPDIHTIASALGLSIDPGAYLVLAKSSAADSIGPCALPWDYLYGTNLNFSNSEAETLRLSCPAEGLSTAVIDEVPYRFVTADPRGVSWQLAVGNETAAGNDAAASWCFAEPAGMPWACTVGEDTNYGSPGVASTCP